MNETENLVFLICAIREDGTMHNFLELFRTSKEAYERLQRRLQESLGEDLDKTDLKELAPNYYSLYVRKTNGEDGVFYIMPMLLPEGTVLVEQTQA